MLRPKQRILLLVSCLAACFIVYILNIRGREQAEIKQNREQAELKQNREQAELKQNRLQVELKQNMDLAQPGLEKYSQANSGNSDSQASNLIEIVEEPQKGADIITATTKAVTEAMELQTKALEPIKTGCKIYSELRNVDFQQPALQYVLCSGIKAYEKTAAGFPLCRLKNPFDERLLRVVRSGSASAELLDMRNSKVKIFVYPEKDYISERIKTSHQWEPELVHTTMKFALKVPNATFLDAGCNIGVYSLLAARLGLPVVSLDANIRNLLRLRLSLSVAALDAALVWNFIGSGDQLSYLNFPGDCNVGGATKFGRAVTDSIPVMPVRSERLCSLIGTKNVVIKLDIEGGEADFLRTSGCLFTQFKVAVVQMEFLRRHMVGDDSSTIVQFFTSKKYTAWKTPGLAALDTKSAASWGDGDIIWVHEEFQQLVAEVRKTSR